MIEIIFAFQSLFPFTPDQALYGVVKSVLAPSMSLNKWFDGTFQQELEEYVSLHSAFRGYLIKTSNQINTSLFKDGSAKAGLNIILGKNGYLFEKIYIDGYRKNEVIPVASLEEKIIELHKLQEYLSRNNKQFLFIFAPNKALFMPEYLPEAYRKIRQTNETSNYEQTMHLLAKYNINTFDGEKYFESLKATTSYPLFTKGGVHWSQYGACMATQKLMNILEEQIKKKVAHISCLPESIDTFALGSDNDLANVLNVWNHKMFTERLAHPKFIQTSASTIYKPRILFIGDSFIWNMLDILVPSNALSSSIFFYYYKSSGLTPAELKPIQKDKLDWSHLLSSDVIIIESNSPALHDIGFGFVKDALLHLEYPRSHD